MAEIESNLLVEALKKVAEDKKAWDPVVLHVARHTSITDYFLVCEGETDRQNKAIADAMLERARELGVRPRAMMGYEDGIWILIDFSDVVVHVFLPGERAYYDLEGLWRGIIGRSSGGRSARLPAAAGVEPD